MEIGVGWFDSVPKEMFDDLHDLTKGMKPNPNKYPIVDKWNYKYVYLPNRTKIYECVERIFNVGFMTKVEQDISGFADGVDIGFGDSYTSPLEHWEEMMGAKYAHACGRLT